MGAGPSTVHPRVLQAMTSPIIGHLDVAFLRVMDDVMDALRAVFQTENKMTLPISGTGSAGMEAAICNLVEPGDTVVVAVNGFFGQRMVDMASRCGGEVHVVEFPWGQPVGPDLTPLEEELKKHARIKVVGVVHGETSTGILNPVVDVAKLAHSYGALVIADAVTTLGGVEVEVDQWDLDVAHSATQKCLGGPPGLAPISLGPRAVKALADRKTRVQSFYLNLVDLETYWDDRRVYHHTAPISMIYSIREALRMAMEEGLEARYQRHARNAHALRSGLEALGLKLFANQEYRLDPLTTVSTPDGVDEAKVRRTLLLEYGIEIAGGLGQLAGRVWRIGLMGESSREANVLTFLPALERILLDEGYEVAVGAALAGAQRALAEG